MKRASVIHPRATVALRGSLKAAPKASPSTSPGLSRCFVCRCTEMDACANSCGWARPRHAVLLCTNCDEILAQLEDYIEVVRQFRPIVLIRLAVASCRERLTPRPRRVK